MSLPTPNTRKEQYLNAIATGNAGGLPTPITREEEYLEAIAKGGGSGDGDMKKSVYDSDLDVAGAGGIKAFVNDAVSGKVDKVEGKGLSTNDYTDEAKAIVDGVTGALAEKADTADIPDLVSDNLAEGILGNETVLSTDTVPFVSKIMNAGKYQRKKFVGCSFVWNQLVVADKATTEVNGVTFTNNGDGSFTVNGTASADCIFVTEVNYFSEVSNGTKVLLKGCPSGGSDTTYGIGLYHRQGGRINAADKGNGAIINITTTGIGYTYIYVKEGCTVNNLVFKPNCHNLTQLFGSTAIADYIYNLEQATAGAGVEKLKELGLFAKDYYAYDAGSIQSVDIKEYAVTGKNLVEETINATIDSTGTVIADIQNWKLHIAKVIKGITYTIKSSELFVGGFFISKPSVGSVTYNGSRWADTPVTFMAPITGYVAFRSSSDYTTPQIEVGSQSTSYEPYHKTTYPLTPTELRGVPKLDANNNIYCDGDEYASDGGHTEKYDIVDLGTLNWTYDSTNLRFYAILIGARTNNVQVAYTRNCMLSSAKYNKMFDKIAVGYADMLTAISVKDNIYWMYTNASLEQSIQFKDTLYTSAEDFKAAMSGVYLVYEKATPTTETLTPFDYPQSVGSLEEIVDYKVEQEQRDVTIPTGHVTEYMGKGGEFTLPTLPETPSVLAYDGHNFFWKPETA